jgi:hypothetical protein
MPHVLSVEAIRTATRSDNEQHMSVEKAFAIHAAPDEIYAAIERDLTEAASHEGDTFEVLRRDPPRQIDLRVTIGGVPCWLTYRITPRENDTEVAGVITPYGWRYTFFTIITFGLRKQGFEVALVEGLANLKRELEGGSEEDAAADAWVEEE